MDQETLYLSFADEFEKIAKGGRDVGQLLSSLAERSGVKPSNLPSIKQVQNAAASGNRGRAAEIAKNVRSYLKSSGSSSASSSMPRSAPNLQSVGLSRG